MISIPDQEQNESSTSQKILALAALYEGAFSVDWLQEIWGGKASQILNVLDLGVKKRWISQSAPDRFRFTDSKIRLDLLTTMSDSKKEEIRQQAVEIMLKDLPVSEDEFQTATTMLLHVNNNLQGCQFLYKKGNQYRKIYQYEKALQCFTKVIKDLEVLKGDAVELLLMEATIQYSKVSSSTLNTDHVISAVQKAIEMAEIKNYQSYWVLLKMNLAKHEWLRSNFQIAIDLFDEGWSVYQKLQDPELRRSILVLSTYFQYWKGRFRETIHNYETLAPEIEDLPQSEFPILTRLMIGLSYAYRGQISYGLAILESLRKHCLKKKNMTLVGHINGTIAGILLTLDQYDLVTDNLEVALQECTANNYNYGTLSALLGMAFTCYKLNETQKAVSWLKEFLAMSGKVQIGFRNMPFIMELCWAMKLGEFPQCSDLSLEKEIEDTLNSQNIFMRGMAYYYQALLGQRNGSSGREVIGNLETSINWLKISGHEIYLAKVRFELARIYLNMGLLDHAKSLTKLAGEFILPINKGMIPKDLRFLVEDLSDRKDFLSAILKLSQEMITIRDSRELSTRIISTVIRITGAERGALLLFDEKTGKITLRAAKNLTEEDLNASDFSSSYRIIERTFKSTEGIVVDFETEKTGAAQQRSIQSCICVPLILRENVVGALYCDNSLFRGSFKNEDIEIFNYFAAQVAIALDNSQAYAALQEMYQKQKEENRYLEEQYLENVNFEDIIGKSNAINRVFKQISSVSRTDATVLILGETGVGKELVARAIHRESDRSQGPFVRVNCSVFSEHLIASELFGHEKGAFTGAVSRQIGRFELAHGGTLFLDEIGDIPLSVQVQLLRVIQSKQFERVGGQKTLSSDFRLMTATNRDLEQAVEDGRFRKDLFYRLGVFPIHIPPLRDRFDDIPSLAYHFLRLFAKKFNKNIEKIPHDEMQKLLAYPWPGNVRELENIMERGAIVNNGPYFMVPSACLTPSDTQYQNKNMSLDENERAHIIRVLKMTMGKVRGHNGAAEVLKIHPNTLYSRMKKLGVRYSAKEMDLKK